MWEWTLLPGAGGAWGRAVEGQPGSEASDAAPASRPAREPVLTSWVCDGVNVVRAML